MRTDDQGLKAPRSHPAAPTFTDLLPNSGIDRSGDAKTD